MRNQVPRVTAALIAVNAAVFVLAEIISGSTESTETLIRWGGAYVPYVRSGSWWRLLTAMFMHAGIRHLINNMLLLFIMGRHLETLIGSVRFALLYLGSGIAANYAAYRWYDAQGRNIVAVGASGAIFAVIGALVWIIIRCKGKADGLSMRQMLILLAFSLYFGFATTSVSNVAHISGLIFGFLLSILLYHKGKGKTYYV